MQRANYSYCCRKRGAGKSTLAINLSAQLSRQKDVHLLDTDIRQRSSSKWIDLRNAKIENGEDLPIIHNTSKTGNIKPAIADLSLRHEVVMIDTQGRDNKAARFALLNSDLILIPMQANYFNLATLENICELLEETWSPEKPRVVRLVFTQISTHVFNNDLIEAKKYIDAYVDIHEDENFDILKSFTNVRSAYGKAESSGLGVVEGTDSKAKAEIQLILQEALESLNEPESV
ncbi:division plane positioning ATPase MipZ [Piscirickettsia salmonis]|uniref:division plane positioning ATPase MipZ n=1 Tax=Piscirickettsia salmonis TaxID=1238 RepID=UPI0016624244|nr:division plane positioning ATPase MipZ [Piscirickettsia salmonis]QNR82090.1 hypothetical protein ICC15_12550 [Piscirickettsia salmonis]